MTKAPRFDLFVASKPGEASWRARIAAACFNKMEHSPIVFSGPIAVTLFFIIPRPANYSVLHNPLAAFGECTFDRLISTTLNGVRIAGIWRNEHQITAFGAARRVAKPEENAGCFIRIELGEQSS